MSSKFGALDLSTLTNETWELYQLCLPLADEAPDGFQRLVNELRSLQTSLRAFGNEIGSNTAFFDSMGENREETLGRCVNACFQTLQRLRNLVSRYRELGIGDGRHVWRKIKWITQRQQVENIRSKLMVHACNLTLCLSPIGKWVGRLPGRCVLTLLSASLVRIENTVNKAMENGEKLILALEQPRDRESDFIISPLSIRGGFSIELEDTSGTARARMASHRPLSPSPRSKHVSTSSESVISGSDSSFYGTATTTSTSPLWTTTRSISQNLLEGKGHSRIRSDQPLPEIFNGTKLDKACWDQTSGTPEKEVAERASEKSQSNFGRAHVTEAINSAMQQLREARLKERLARPIQYEGQNALHKPDAELTRAFEASIHEGSHFTQMAIKDWLRIATWWLLKARATLANCNRHNLVTARGSVNPSTTSGAASNQAYVDLLKAWYILYDVVLKDESSPAPLTDENLKSIADLSEVDSLVSMAMCEY